MKKTPLKIKTGLKMRGTLDTSVIKERIQSILRQIAIKRDGGCLLRNYPDTGLCGSYTKSGDLILQAEHLISRSNGNTFGDTRNIICLCQRHHIYWKPQHSQQYWEIIEAELGVKRWEWLQAATVDYKRHKTYKVDWKLILIGLEQELKKLKNK